MKRIDYKIPGILLLQFLVFALMNGFGVLGTDDIYTIHTTSNKLLEVLNLAIYFEMQAPLYFVLMSVWREISDTLFWAKMFHYISFSISTLFFYKILRILVANKKDIYILLLLFALHSFIYSISNDLRRYSLTLLFAVITLYYFIRIYIQEDDSKRNHSLLILVSTIGIFNDYYHSFLLASLGAGVLFSKNKNKWRYYADMIIPFIGFLILLRFIIYQVDSSSDWSISYIKTNLFIASLKHIFILIESQTYSYLNFGWWPGNLIFRLSLIFGFLFILKKRAFDQYITRNSVLVISAAVMIIFYLMVIVALKSTIFLRIHYVAFSFPLIFLCFSLLLASAFKNDLIRIIVVFGYMAISCVSYYDAYNSYKYNKDLKELSSMVDNELSKQIVFVFNPKNAERINYYLDRSDNNIVGVPGELDLAVYDYSARNIESEEQIRSIIENTILHNDEFYVIIRRSILESNAYNSQIMYNYLSNNYKNLSQESYRSFLILKYRVIAPDIS